MKDEYETREDIAFHLISSFKLYRNVLETSVRFAP